MKLSLTGSGLPRALDCPASAWLPDDAIKIDEQTQVASTGTECHKIVAWCLTHKNDDVDAAADALNLPHSDAGWMARRVLGWVFADAMGADLTHVEVRVTYRGIVGHADIILYFDDGRVVAIDIKTGYKDDYNYWPQLQFYGLGAAGVVRSEEDRQSITLFIAWPRHNVIDRREFTVDEQNDMMLAIDDIVSGRNRDTYRPGDACQYCPRRHDCPALQTMSRDAVARIIGESLSLADLTPDQLIEGYQRVQAAEKACELFRDALKLRIDTDGQVVATDGRVLALEESHRDDIDAQAAWPVMAEVLSGDELAGVVAVTKTKLEKAIKAKLGRGLKDKGWMQFLDTLRDAGAITKKPNGKRLKLSLPQLESKETP